MSQQNIIFRFFGGIWRVVDAMRRGFVNIIFLIFLFWLIAVIFSGDDVTVPETAALVLSPDGNLVDQLEGDALDRATWEITGDEVRQTLVRDLTESIRLAKDDDRIKVLVLNLDGMWGGGLSKLQRLGAAIDDFKSSGKKVIAMGDAYMQNQYFVAAHADEVYMHPLGAVFVQGYGSYRTYFRDALDKLFVDWNIFRVGEYKSFVEPYIRNDMSDEDREAKLVWLGKLWDNYRKDVVNARGLELGQLQQYADGFSESLSAGDGDMAQLAVDKGMVDGLLNRDEMRQKIIDIVGLNAKTKSYNSIGHESYLQAQRLANLSTSANKVGVIVASGTIVGGSQPSGTIGGDSTAKLIRQAAADDSIKAVVLQIDSGGGSMFASEVILRELEQLKATGKPVYTSMSSVAASGGYYIALGGDEIWANPTTITGSIGVLAMFPTFNRTLNELGVHVDGLGTTKLAGAIRPDRPLTEEGRDILQKGVEESYEFFIRRVAEARGLEVDAVDEVARGRVWIGEDAKDLGLVDEFGTIQAVIAKAAETAGVADDYDVKYLEKEMSFRERLLLSLLGKASTLAPEVIESAGSKNSFAGLADKVSEKLNQISGFNDPRNMYMLCLCTVE